MDLVCDELDSDSPYIETIWHSHSETAGPFISMAEARSGFVITRFRGKATLTLRGPETRATLAANHAGAEFVGVRFRPGVFMPAFLPEALIDRQDVALPNAGARSFWLQGSAWEIPAVENMDVFVDRLARAGLLIHDPVVLEVLQGHPVHLSPRTVQRRFLQAAGLTQASMLQVERARRAVDLLKQGVSILDTVAGAGYFDQPHLTRALKYYIGLTPAQVNRGDRPESLSFLYKTTLFNDATLLVER